MNEYLKLYKIERLKLNKSKFFYFHEYSNIIIIFR
jgi:hypothetical protein